MSCDNLIPGRSCKFCILDVFSSHQFGLVSVGGASVKVTWSVLIYTGCIIKATFVLTCI